MVTIDAWHWRRVGGVVAAAALVVLSAGCTGSDPAPTPSSTVPSTPTSTTPPPTSSAPPTATPTGTDGIPAAAKAHTTAGAEAFVRYFFDQLVVAWTRPSSSALASLCDSTSKSCAAFRSTAGDLTKNKQMYDRAPLEVTSLVYTSTDSGVLRLVMEGAQTASHIVDKTGKVVETFERQPSHLAIYVRWTGSAWIIHDIKQVA